MTAAADAAAVARGFASDNYSGAHPEVIEAVAAANVGHAPAYGEDAWTAAALATLREHFGPDSVAYPVFNGTAANVLALDALTRPHEAVICAATAHLNVDECGAPERIAGVKLLTIEAPGGKLTPQLVERAAEWRQDQHAVQPRVVSIANATELGTVYRAEEIEALARDCRERGLLLHVDGARLANAAASLGLTLRELTCEVGVDAVSFGATKNGALWAECVVFCRPELAEGFPFVRKQGMQLASKMRFVSAQIEALMRGDLWRRSAAHANAMARRLAEAAGALDGVDIVEPVEANAVFAALDAEAAARLRERWPGLNPFYVWQGEVPEAGADTDPHGPRPRQLLRWMCSWDTTADDVDRFAAELAEALSG